jgi:pimeloyl-ACP methyl ester carboxylesterase
MVAPVEALAAIPESLSDVEAAPLLCAGITIFNALRHSGAFPGDLVAVLGIGGLGHLGIQFANKFGYKVAAIGRGSENAALAKKLGATLYIDSKSTNAAEALQKLGGAQVILATAPSSKAMSELIDGLGANWKTRRAFWADRAANESTLRTNLLSLATTRTRHVGNDPNVERYDPDLWTDEFAFLNQPGQADIQSDLFYDYRTNVDAYPKWQAWMREKQPRLLVIWGKYDLSFDLSEPEAYRRDVPKAEVHVLNAGHFALDTAADEIAALVRGFLGSPR